MAEKIKIILADDHQLMRKSWGMLLMENNNFLVIAECNNGEEAIEKTAELHPDIVLLDINMSPINGFDATKIITQQCPDTKIIGLSSNTHFGYAQKMIGLGAKGYMTKTSSLEELTHAIFEVYNNKEYLCKEVQDSPYLQ